MPTIVKGLAQLEEVEWSSLDTAHGKAGHVPIALKALAGAHDADELLDAYWQLDNYVVLQGTIYESAYFAIPYILDILLSSQWAPIRVAAYDLLVEIARGVPNPARPWSPRPGVSEDPREACRKVIASGLTLCEPDLSSTDTDRDVRRRALDLFTSFDDAPDGRLKTLLTGIDPGEDLVFGRLLHRARGEL